MADQLYTTQYFVQAVVDTDPALTCTQYFVQVAVDTNPSLTLTQQFLTVPAKGELSLALTQYFLTAAVKQPVSLQVTQGFLVASVKERSQLQLTQNFLTVAFKPDLDDFDPTRDISTGNWTDTPIYQGVDKDDSFYTFSPLGPTGSTNDSFEVEFDGINNVREDSALFRLFMRIQKVDSSNVPADHEGDPNNPSGRFEDDLTLKVEIKAGSTVLWTDTLGMLNADSGITWVDVPIGVFASQPFGTKISVKVTADTVDYHPLSPGWPWADMKVKISYMHIKTLQDPWPPDTGTAVEDEGRPGNRWDLSKCCPQCQPPTSGTGSTGTGSWGCDACADGEGSA